MSFLDKILPTKQVIEKPQITLAKSPSSGAMYATIKPQSLRIQSKDIADYNKALQSAYSVETPSRKYIADIFNDILNDAHLSGQIDIRKLQVLNNDFTISKTKKSIPEVELFFKQNIFNNIIQYYYDSMLYGHCVYELTPTIEGILIQKIPFANIVPEKGYFYPDATDIDKFIKYRELRQYGTSILEMGGNELGILNKATPHILFKKFANANWSELCEIYGIPPIVIKTNTSDPKQFENAKQTANSISGASRLVIDIADEFSFANMPQNLTGDIYKNLISFSNNEISILINGAIIGQDTKFGTRGKEDASMDIQWQLIQADMRSIEFEINKKVLPALTTLKKIPDGLSFQFSKYEDINKLWTMTKESMPYYNIKAEWLKEKFGIEAESRISNTPNTLHHQPDFFA